MSEEGKNVLKAMRIEMSTFHALEDGKPPQLKLKAEFLRKMDLPGRELETKETVLGLYDSFEQVVEKLVQELKDQVSREKLDG